MPHMNRVLNKMSSASSGLLAGVGFPAGQQPALVATLMDDQEKCMNYDIQVTLTKRMNLVFPMTNILLGTPRGSRGRVVAASVRMPVERPLFK